MIPQLLLAGAGAFAKYKQGKANEKFAQKQLDLQNKEAREEWNRKNDQFHAETAARASQLQGQAAASRKLLEGQRGAFNLSKEAEESESAQREKFAKALLDFGNTNKEANLKEAKAKRSGRASKAAKGAKVSGTGGRAGRLSGAFRSGARGAVTAGLNEAATTAGMQAALTGYGADLNREFGLVNELGAQGAVVGGGTKRKRELARLRESLAGRDKGYMLDSVGAKYAMDSSAAQMLGRSPVRQTYGGSPDYGIWDKVGAIADIGSTAYGLGAFDKAPTGYGYTYGPGTDVPNGYVGNNAPYLPQNSPVRQTRQYQGY